MAQYGFYFNQQACIGCMACQVACKDANDLPVGVFYRKVNGYETGEYPTIGRYIVSASCNHCANPACVEICPTGAMYKDEATGLVLHKDDDCIGCKSCMTACPYQVPQYLVVPGIVGKCGACLNAAGGDTTPACVSACNMRALEFGDIEELAAKHADETLVDEIACMPSAQKTTPSILINARPAAFEADFRKDAVW